MTAPPGKWQPTQSGEGRTFPLGDCPVCGKKLLAVYFIMNLGSCPRHGGGLDLFFVLPELTYYGAGTFGTFWTAEEVPLEKVLDVV